MTQRKEELPLLHRKVVPTRSCNVDELSKELHKQGIFVFRDFLTMKEPIGLGHFGCIYKAELNLPLPTDVAVKTLRQYDLKMKIEASKHFIEEGLRMREFDHENILHLIAISFKRNGMPMLVTPFMKHGDLLTYLRDEINTPTVKDLICFAIQCARGMEYLAKQKFIHRDLAARNCLLDEHLTLKIADFGLSKNVYTSAYYASFKSKTLLPVRWMAIECIPSYRKAKFTLESDVWSYGVVIWELLTRGEHPYDFLDSLELIDYLKSGKRLDQPPYCPNLLYEIMLSCWQEEPQTRPTFEKLLHHLDALLEHLNRTYRAKNNNVEETYPVVRHKSWSPSENNNCPIDNSASVNQDQN